MLLILTVISMLSFVAVSCKFCREPGDCLHGKSQLHNLENILNVGESHMPVFVFFSEVFLERLSLSFVWLKYSTKSALSLYVFDVFMEWGSIYCQKSLRRLNLMMSL